MHHDVDDPDGLHGRERGLRAGFGRDLGRPDRLDPENARMISINDASRDVQRTGDGASFSIRVR